MKGAEFSIALRNYADEPGDWSWFFDSVAAAEASGFDRVVISEHIAMGDNWTPAWVDLDGEAQVSKHNVRREREERPPRVSVVAEHGAVGLDTPLRRGRLAPGLRLGVGPAASRHDLPEGSSGARVHWPVGGTLNHGGVRHGSLFVRR